MNPKNFFAELKRRNVYKVAVAYAIVAWLLIQAASILFPTFEAPAWVMKVFVTAVLLGFPVALILAWAFELTPDGIKRAEDIAPNESITRKTGRRLVAITAALAVIAAGLFVFQYVHPRGAERSATPTPSSTSAGQKSIAVLPFVNMSGDKNDEYLSDGMTEELLNVLAKVKRLRVPGRSSSFAFKGRMKRASSAKSASNCTLTRSWRAACARPARSCGLRPSSSTWPMAFIFGRKPTTGI